MARFVQSDQPQRYLLPPDLRDWLPDDDLVHFVVEAVERVPMLAFEVNERGTGSAQYHPRTMLALLVYCYANGIFGSRRIERATYRDIGVRYVAAHCHPDHEAICTFRRNNFDAVAEAFVQVLLLAKELKLLRVGTVGVDSTKLAERVEEAPAQALAERRLHQPSNSPMHPTRERLAAPTPPAEHAAPGAPESTASWRFPERPRKFPFAVQTEAICSPPRARLESRHRCYVSAVLWMMPSSSGEPLRPPVSVALSGVPTPSGRTGTAPAPRVPPTSTPTRNFVCELVLARK